MCIRLSINTLCMNRFYAKSISIYIFFRFEIKDLENYVLDQKKNLFKI